MSIYRQLIFHINISNRAKYKIQKSIGPTDPMVLDSNMFPLSVRYHYVSLYCQIIFALHLLPDLLPADDGFHICCCCFQNQFLHRAAGMPAAGSNMKVQFYLPLLDQYRASPDQQRGSVQRGVSRGSSDPMICRT